MKVKELFQTEKKIELSLNVKYSEIQKGSKTKFNALLLEIDGMIDDLVEVKISKIASNLKIDLTKEDGSDLDIYRKIFKLQLLNTKKEKLGKMKNGSWWDWSAVKSKEKTSLLQNTQKEIEAMKIELDKLNERIILNEKIKKIFKKYSKE